MRWLFGAALLAVFPLVLCGGCQKKQEEHKSMFPSVIKTDTKVGTGKEAKTGDVVLLQYVGRLAKDGSLFDSNDPELSEKNKNPLTFKLGPNAPIIAGMLEGVEGMKEGGEREVKIPFTKAYGAESTEGVPSYSDLVFTLKLLWVIKPDEVADVVVEDTQKGTGQELANGLRGEFNYKAKYVNDRVFDDTYAQGKPVQFTPGKNEVITGLDRGVVGMKVGGKRRITLGPAAAWGEYGNNIVAGNQIEIFDIELLRIVPGK